jgi:tetratricopeptide (TPR) repeat protein
MYVPRSRYRRPRFDPAGYRGRNTRTGRVVVLLGEAGVGKSRLARELVVEARKGCTVLTGRALPGYASTGVRAFADALQSAFRTRRPPETEEILPFVAALARLIPDWRSEAVTAPSDPVIVGEGVLRLLRHLAGPSASVLLLEDLHWADAETLAVMDYIADHVATEPVLCVLTCRTDEHSAGGEAIQSLIDRRAVDALGLARLNEAEAMAMAQACLASSEIPLGLPEVVSRADGIPFLVEELLASAVAVGALSREHHGWKLDPSAQRVLPITFADSVRRRIAGVGPNAQTVLQAGAIFGRAFDWTLVGPTVSLADETVVAVLRSAQDHQLIERDRGNAGTVFRFRHALTRDAILGELLPHEQAALATRALEVVQELRPGMPGEWCATAIRLAETAGLNDRAAELLRELASREVAVGALAAAEGILERAGERAKTAPLRVRVDVEAALLDVLAQAGNTDRAVLVAERLLLRLDQLGADDRRRAAVHLSVARALAAASRWEAADQHLDQARQQATPAASRLLASIEALAAEVAMGQQRLSEARDRAQAALDIAEASDMPDATCHALEVLGRAARVHDLDVAERYFTAAVQLAGTHGLVLRHVRALHELGTIGMLRGHRLDYLERASQLALQAGALATAAVVNLQLGAVYVGGRGARRDGLSANYGWAPA